MQWVSKEVEFCNRDRFIELGLTIASLRKMQGLSQEKLAEKAKISRSHLSSIRLPTSCVRFPSKYYTTLRMPWEFERVIC